MKKISVYGLTSLAASIFDLVIFELIFIYLDEHGEIKAIFIATIIARIISSIIGYQLNKHYVFKTIGNRRKELPRYTLTIVVQMLLSASIVSLTNKYISFNEVVEKCVVDLLLFFVFYFVNKNFVYRKKMEEK